MYSIDFERDMPYLTWESIRYGIEQGLLDPESAQTYANKISESAPDTVDACIVELLIAEPDDILTALRQITAKPQFEQSSAARALRAVLLYDACTTATSNHELLLQTEEIYADFENPADMDGLVYYLPPTDPDWDVTQHSEKENEGHLAEKIRAFSAAEIHWLHSRLQ